MLPTTDLNLLFGVLALQADLIDPDRFAEACTAWAARKDTPLAQILRQRGWLSAEEQSHLDFLLQRKLQKHQGDAHASLAEAAGPAIRCLLTTLDDSEVRNSVAELSPAGPELLSTVAYEPEGRERYTLSRLHAKGGIGQVWLAHDADLGRAVALKELRPERATQPTARARFLEEAQITGQLEHPGIVPVYELARRQENAQPFYTMRFVEGRTLREAVRAYHSRRQKHEAGALELSMLLNAFVAVCNAVAYAHSRGVLHRDLKPDNVVLGDYGEVLLLDWGLAKVLGVGGQESGVSGEEQEPPGVAVEGNGERAATVQGQVLGTPAYMAPEQAAGRLDLLDRRSDVYGLDAMLYEVLTGQAPFEGSDNEAVLRQVCTQEPPTPRERVAEVPAALEAVCLKALAKKRSQRYASAGAVAEEVRRFLADEPVTAFPEPVTRRLGRWGRKHRPAVAAAAALLSTATAALAIGLVLVNQERANTKRANADLAEANDQLADRNHALSVEKARTRTALDNMTSEMIDDLLARQKLLTPQQKKFLEGALREYEELARESGTDEQTRAGVAGAYMRVGDIRRRLGLTPGAEKAYRRSKELYAHLAADFPTVPEYRGDLANSRNNLGFLLSSTGHPHEAEGEYRAARAIRTQLVTDFPNVADYRRGLASSYGNLGNLLSDTGHLREAEAEYRAALIIEKQLAADFPAVLEYRGDLAKSHNNLGLLLSDTGRPHEAEAECRAALAVREQLAADLPSVSEYRRDLAGSHINLGNLLSGTGHRREAEKEYRAALVIYKQLAAEFPTVPAYRSGLARCHGDVGGLLSNTGHQREAEEEYRAALVIEKQLAADFPTVPEYRSDLAKSHVNLGNLLSGTGQLRDAEAEYRAALAIGKALAADFPSVSDYRSNLAASQNNLGILLANMRRPREAEAEYRAALAVRKQLAADFPTVPDYQNDVAAALVNMARLSLARRDFPGARRLLDEALPYHRAALKANPHNPVYLAFFRNNTQALAETLVALSRHAEAAAAADRLMTLAVTPSDDDYNASCILALCVPLAQKDAKLSAGERQKLAQSYADRAMAALQKAVAAGYRDVKHMQEDHDLDSLRSRADFKKLIASLQSAPAPGRPRRGTSK